MTCFLGWLCIRSITRHRCAMDYSLLVENPRAHDVGWIRVRWNYTTTAATASAGAHCVRVPTLQRVLLLYILQRLIFNSMRIVIFHPSVEETPRSSNQSMKHWFDWSSANVGQQVSKLGISYINRTVAVMDVHSRTCHISCCIVKFSHVFHVFSAT